MADRIMTVLVRLKESDKLMVEKAAYKCRLSQAAWIRNLIVDEARNQLGAVDAKDK